MSYPTEWQTDSPGIRAWDAEATVWEAGLFDAQGVQTGSAVSFRRLNSHVSTVREFGLHLRYRQVKAYKPPAPKKPVEKEYLSVRIEEYDIDGNFSDLTVETRMVYKNTKGEYIKTRGDGNVRITYVKDDGTRVIVYKVKPHRYRNGRGEVFLRNKRTLISPE